LKILGFSKISGISVSFQEKIISRKEFPAKITRTDVFLVIYRNSPRVEMTTFERVMEAQTLMAHHIHIFLEGKQIPQP
jgi:hypothetical protein